MKAAALSLLALLTMAGSHPAFAKAPARSVAIPIGSPGAWIGAGDYPATALRFEMTGITVFKLTIDDSGKPSRCDIIESSGFEVLDTATCERLMANARFAFSRGPAGKPTDHTYSNRVRWVLPTGDRIPVSERFASFMLTIDDKGRVSSCRAVVHVPAVVKALGENSCGQVSTSLPPAMGLEIRGSFPGPSAEVELRLADVFTTALRSQVLSTPPDYQQRSLNIHRFTVTNDGKLGQCAYAEQRGSSHFSTDFCLEARRENFDPPFSTLDKDGIASGWHIARVLLKTGQ